MASLSGLLNSIHYAFSASPRGHRRGRTERFRTSALEQLESRVLLSADYADNRVILSLQATADLADIRGAYPGSDLKPLGDYGLYLVTLPNGVDPMATLGRFQYMAGVNFAEPDWTVTRESIPNDARFPEQWNLHNIGQTVVGQVGVSGSDVDASLAWDIYTGSRSVIIAIVDDGIDYTHPDLAANMWTNTGEIAGNSIDDDGNGYTDDIYGYDFGNLDADPAPDPGDEHGTHVAGIAGAVGNNGIGISGVNWNVQLMAVKIFGTGGGSFVSTIVDSLNYAVANGASVSNHSYNTGTGGPILAHQAAIVNAQSKGHVFVASAGNTGGDNDIIDHYPSDYPLDNVVAVAATDNQDAKASFSNIGLTTVHLGAPGVDILSTIPGANYGLNSGTSMASPHVAGAVAFLMSLRPDLNYQDILGALFRGVDQISALQGVTITGGRMNLKGAIDELPALPDPTPGIPIMIAPTGSLGQPVPQFEWSAAQNAASYELEVDNLTTGRLGFYVRTVTTTTHVADRQFSEGDYRARARTVTAQGLISAYSNYVNFTIDIPAPSPPVITRPQGDIGDSFPTFEWTSSTAAATYSLWVSSITSGQRVIFRTGHDSTTYTHFNPLPDGAYRAWVRAFNAVGEYSAWSTPVQFTIDAPIPIAPTITAPAAVTTSINPRIIWTAVDGASSYDLWINNLSTAKSQYVRQTNLARTPTYYDPPVLTQGNYTAWIRAANGNGEYSPWSTGYSFTVDILPPATPTLTGPLGLNGSTTVTTVTPTFTWTTAARASLYDLWVNNMTTGQAQIVRKSDLKTTSYTSLSNLTQGEYRAFIRAINSAGEVGEWSNAFVFTIDEPTPSVPTITGPLPNPAGSIETATPTFTWTSSVKAPLYELKIDDLTLNTVNVIRVTGINKESYAIPTAKRFAEHTYVAQVRAYNTSGDTSAWSELYRFRIDVPEPSTPTPLGPGDTSRDTTPEFTWTHASNSVRYEILVRDLVRGENIVLNVTSFGIRPDGTTAFYILPNAQALRPSTYRFWIRAFNSLGQSSSWSSSKTFVISAKLDPSLLQDGDMFANADEVLLASAVMTAEPQQTDNEASESANQSFNAQPQAPAYGGRDSMPQPSREARIAVNAAEGDDTALIDATMWMLSDPSVGTESRTAAQTTTRS